MGQGTPDTAAGHVRVGLADGTGGAAEKVAPALTPLDTVDTRRRARHVPVDDVFPVGVTFLATVAGHPFPRVDVAPPRQGDTGATFLAQGLAR